MVAKPPDTRTRARWFRYALRGMLALGVLTLAVYSFRPKPVPVETTIVRRGPLEVTVFEDGQARVKDRYIVSAPLAGHVGRIELHAGEPVKQSQELARVRPLPAPLLDPRTKNAADARIAAASSASKQAYAQIEGAQAALERATRDLARLKRLAQSGSVSEAQLEQSEIETRTLRSALASFEFGAKVADYELKLAQSAKGRLSPGKDEEVFFITSPIDGRVLRILHESEGAVQPGTPLLELGDPHALEVAVDILSSDAVRISPSARVTLERWGGEPLRGVVRSIEPSAFTKVSALGVEEQRVNVIVAITSSPELFERLGDGYRVEAKILLSETPNALKVRTSATFRNGPGWAVFAVRKSRAVQVSVELGASDGVESEVKRGLHENDIVVVHPSDRVRDGVAIVPL